MEETANYAVAESSEGSLLKSLTFAVAMSFHSILEGFALGVQVLGTSIRFFFRWFLLKISSSEHDSSHCDAVHLADPAQRSRGV